MTVPCFGFPPAPMAADPPPPPESEPVDAPAEDTEDDRLREWRIEHLEAAGLPYPLALQLALIGADWHRVKRAVDGGMTVDQVERTFL